MKIDTLAIAALVELGALGKEDWESALQQILRIDASVLGVERVSYWSFRKEPAGITCELGFENSMRSFERGAHLAEGDCKRYLMELRKADVLAANDVSVDERLRELDEYMGARNIRSLMDVPIWVRSDLTGILCHEHTSLRNWTHGDLEFALAVSHSLSATLEARHRNGAETAARRSDFLSRVSVELGNSLDLEKLAEQTINLVVPEVADWAMLDFLENGRVRRLATAHKDPDLHTRFMHASRLYPPGLDQPHMSTLVLRLGQSILHPLMSSAHLSRYTVNAEHFALIHPLGARSAMCVPLMSAGKVTGALSLISSERIYRQDDLKLVEELMERVSCAFTNAQLYNKAQNAITVRDEFISLAAHEFRTPLNGLRLSVEMVARLGGTPLRNTEPFKLLVRQVDHLCRLAEQLLDVTQIDGGHLSIDLECSDLAEVVKSVAQAFKHRLARAGCHMTLDLDSPVPGRWDTVRIERMLSNLLDNAIKFASGQPLEVSVSAQNGEAVLVVQDHGDGIPPEHVQNVFGRYERGVPPRTIGGLGLGLYVVRAIVDAHGGTISVDNRPGEGTGFTVKLPRWPPTPTCMPVRENSDGNATENIGGKF